MDKFAEIFAILMNKFMDLVVNVRDFVLALMGKLEYRGVIA